MAARYYQKCFAAVLVFFVIDRAAKWLALNALPSEGYFVIPEMTGVVLERNQGIAYSIALPDGWLTAVIALIIVILIGLLVRAYKRREAEAVTALSLIIAGAFSNFLDRLQYGYVVDMLVLTAWPVFNLADLMILAGTIWLILKIFSKTKKNQGLKSA